MNPIMAFLGGLGRLIDRQAKINQMENDFGHKPTLEKFRKNIGKRGMGYTKRPHAESKKRRKIAAASRRINRKYA